MARIPDQGGDSFASSPAAVGKGHIKPRGQAIIPPSTEAIDCTRLECYVSDWNIPNIRSSSSPFRNDSPLQLTSLVRGGDDMIFSYHGLQLVKLDCYPEQP